MLDLLALANIRSISTEQRDGALIVDAQSSGQLGLRCAHCGAPEPHRHDNREQEFADAPVRGQPVRIRLARQRFRCRGCRKTFFEPLQGFSVKRNMTQRLVHYIAKDALIRTFSDVARDVGLDVQTVRGVFMDFGAWLRQKHPIETPRVLGVDEAKRAKVVCSVFTDLERREYFDMIPSRKTKPLNTYLAAMPNKDRVEVVAMDLHIGFVSAIGRHLPKAVRVADRFHVARLAQDAFDKAHVDARKGLATGARLAMFRQRRLLGERRPDQSEAQRGQVDAVLAPFPVLRAAYEAKETFLEIYDATTRVEAERRLAAWLNGLPTELTAYFRALTSAVSLNREIILNYFNHRYTNAFTEAANGISKLMQRMGRGYGFDVMKVKLLYGKRAQTLDIKDFDAEPAEKPTYGLMTRVSMGSTRGKSQQTARGRRGPNVQRVGQLIDDGYYDLGNKEIAEELEPLVGAFARES